MRERLGNRPVLIAGMAGSDRGWREAPYLPCPADLRDLARALVWVEPGRVAIIPGLSLHRGGRADVMRGEETQLLGLSAMAPGAATTTVCHPGTHTKWVALEGTRITGFRTVMTGELFALLRRHSLLAGMLGGEVAPGAAFARGVAAARGGGVLSAQLFEIRARVLLGDLPRADAAAFASGLLIGWDIAAGLEAAAPRPVVVMGSPQLTALHAAALADAGVPCRTVDGAAAFVAGTAAVKRALG